MAIIEKIEEKSNSGEDAGNWSPVHCWRSTVPPPGRTVPQESSSPKRRMIVSSSGLSYFKNISKQGLKDLLAYLYS